MAMNDTTSSTTSRQGQLIALPARKRSLSEAHRLHLAASGLTDESIAIGGFYTERDPGSIAGILHWRSWPRGRGDVLVIPFSLPGQSEPFFARVRPDQPRANEKTGKVVKYEQPKDTPIAPYFPARAIAGGWLADVARPLVFTEGEKKAALLDQLGFAAVGGTGVSCFHDAQHRHDEGSYRLHELIRKHVIVTGRVCFIAFDSDAKSNDQVMRSADVLAAMLRSEGAADVRFVEIPEGDGGAKLGIDDFFVRAGEAPTRALFETAASVTGQLGGDRFTLLTSFRALAGLPVDEALRMPSGYDLGRAGELTRWTDEGKAEVVERAPIFIARFVTDLYTGHEKAELVFRRAGGWRTVQVERRAIADSRMLVAELAPVGGPVDSNTASDVVRWLRDFEAVNERRMPRATSLGRCGWHRVDEHVVFALGGEVLAREGADPRVVVERGADRARLWRGLHVAGSYEGHLEALRRAWDASPICAAAICAALAAPLLRPLAAPLFAVHLAGDSSRGKSSMLKVAASVYGAPQDEEWVTSWNATSVGHEVRASLLCDLPLCIDEAGVVEPKERERAVYMLINGVGRVRGAKEGGLREGHSWRTVVLSTGERMLAEQEAATGAQVRVLQFLVSGFGKLDAPGVDGLRRACEENHGQVGIEWLGALLETSDEEWVAHRAALRARTKALQERAREPLRARQAGFFALLEHVESIAHSVLGIGRENGATMRALFETPGDAGVVVQTAAARALDTVREWLARSPRSFPRLVTSSSGQRVPKRDGPQSDVCGYVDDHDNEVLLVPGALRGYLGERGMDANIVTREWRAAGLLRCDEGLCTTTARIDGKKVRVMALGGEHAGLEEPNTDWGGDG
jgi:hypothetical protein